MQLIAIQLTKLNDTILWNSIWQAQNTFIVNSEIKTNIAHPSFLVKIKKEG